MQGNNPAPGFQKHPDHTVRIESRDALVEVYAGTRKLASTHRPLQLTERGYPAVWYIPLADCNREYLTESAHTTYCPFKGHASYFSVVTDEKTLADAVWYYPTPYDECAALRAHVAFYPDRVQITTAE